MAYDVYRPLLLSLLSLMVVGSNPLRAAQGTQTRRPNVILILTDDQGYGDIGALGNSKIHTPNMDRLHARSVRLTNFHVDPTCSPTRSALMTGRYSTRTGVWHTIAGRSLMRPEEVTLAEIFAAGGYRTAIFGKWHLGDNYPLHARDQGFQESLVLGGGGVGQTPDVWGNDYFDDTYLRNGDPVRFRGYCTDIWFDNALRFIEDNRERPFFAYIPTNAAHGPYHVAESYAKPYVEAGVPQPMANFYGMITNIDENLGRLMEKLDELELTDQTILLFMTDNGTAAGVAHDARPEAWAGYNAGMRGQKGSEYEGGHRVPCFIRYPEGAIGGGRDIQKLTAHVDIVPTLMELCHLERSNGPPIDGTSLLPLLQGDISKEWPDRTLFVHSQRVESPVKWRQCSVMTETWRLVDGKELYNILDDPGQKHDVASKHPEVVDELRDAYEQWWESLSNRFDQAVPILLGAPAENPTRLTCHDWHPTQGPVPWNQDMIQRMPQANGEWAVEIARSGRYRFTLRHQPASSAFPLQADKARLRIGQKEVSAPVAEGDTAATLEIALPTRSCPLANLVGSIRQNITWGLFCRGGTSRVTEVGSTLSDPPCGSSITVGPASENPTRIAKRVE